MTTSLPWIDSVRAATGLDALTSDELIASHSYDWWPLASKWRAQGKQPHAPEAVVFARSTDDVVRLLRWANDAAVPVTAWGLGSSVTGAPLPIHGGVVLDLSEMSRLLDVNDINLTVTVEAGIKGDYLEYLLNERGYSLNHSPQSLDRSTAGGWVATRATGQFSSRYGGIEDALVSAEIVLADGTVVQTRHTPRAAIGPDLKSVFIGSEGTLGIVTRLTLKIYPLAPFRRFEALRFDQLEDGLTAMRLISRAGLRPFLVRYYDADEARHAMVDRAFQGNAMFLGFEGPQEVAQAEYAAALELCAPYNPALLGSAAVEAWMARRYDFSTVEARLRAVGGYAETIEVAHFWDGILPTYHAMKSALRPLAEEVLGHFSHVYPQGTSLYMILLGQAADDAEAEQRIRQIWDVAMNTALQTGAVTSHHHGAGLARLPYLAADLGSGMNVLQAIKRALDPNGILNPGKLGLTP